MNRYLLYFLLLPLSASAQKLIPPAIHADPVSALQVYHENLAQLRQEHVNHRELPNLKFFMFGMGDRLKLIYRNGRLLNALTGNIEEQWRVKQEVIVPSEYLVHLILVDGQVIQIREDETGVWLLQTNKRPKLIPGTRNRVNLPRFADKTFGPVLRVLHQEVLINVINGRPVPNFLMYFKPRYRDAALMAMVMRATDNLPLIRDWIMALRDPFDRINHNIAEADNPGEVLFLVSLVSDRQHPVVQMVLDSVKQFQTGAPGHTKQNGSLSILGKSDGTAHSVYQTKWLKYGLKSLGLPDPYTVPKQYDNYASLFWQDLTHEQVEATSVGATSVGATSVVATSVVANKSDEHSGINDPALLWAEDHFYTLLRRDGPAAADKRGMVGMVDYPLSWQQYASDAHYPGLTVLDKEVVKQKLTFPHSRHAAEMFLLLNK